MSRKKGKKGILQDFTINDCANAPKPVRTIKKSTAETADITWDEIQDDFDIIEETNADGTKNFVYRKKKVTEIPIYERTGNTYPEVIWYWISKHIKPEDVGNFAGINKATYAATKKKSFWLRLYKEYCEDHPKLPDKLRIDSCKAYGLRQTVIKALYHTYDVFVNRVMHQATQDSCPHLLVKRRCVTVWYNKGVTHWSVYFKLKKQKELKSEDIVDIIEEMGRIDANIEEDTQVLMVTCKSFQEVPPVMGMTLSSVSMTLAHGFRHYKLQLGFNTSRYTTKHTLPECLVVLDAVIGAKVCDWWHPLYPFSANVIPRRDPPLLRGDFFDED